MKPLAELSDKQLKIVVEVGSRLEIEDSIQTYSSPLIGEDTKKRVVCIFKLKIDNAMHVLCGLTENSATLFFALSEGVDDDVALLLANLDAYASNVGTSLRLGEIIDFPSSAGASNSLTSVLLSRTATSDDLQKIPDRLSILDESYLCCFVVPLTREEVRIRNNDGHDKLMDHFIASSKGIHFTRENIHKL